MIQVFFCQCFSSIWISFVGPPHYTTRHPLCINFRLQHLIAKSNLELMVKKRWCSNQCCNGVQLAGLLLGFKSRYLWLRRDLTPFFFFWVETGTRTKPGVLVFFASLELRLELWKKILTISSQFLGKKVDFF